MFSDYAAIRIDIDITHAGGAESFGIDVAASVAPHIEDPAFPAEGDAAPVAEDHSLAAASFASFLSCKNNHLHTAYFDI